METNGAQVGQALAIDIFLHARNALIVDIDETEDVRSGWATRIETALFRAEAYARHAERHDLALLARRQPALDPDEARAAFQALVCRFPVEVRQHGGQHFDGFVRIDDLARFGIERRGLDIGGENFAVPVEDIRARCQLLDSRPCIILIFAADDAEIDELSTHHTIDADKTGDGHPQAIACAVAVLLARADKRHVAGQLFIANRLNTVTCLHVLFSERSQPHDQCLAPLFLTLPVVMASFSSTPLASSSSLPEMIFWISSTGRSGISLTPRRSCSASIGWRLSSFS